jgi:hypothetical protein
MFVEIDDVEVAVPQDLIDALKEYDTVSKQAEQAGKDVFEDPASNAAGQKCDMLTKKYFGHLDQEQQWDVVGQFWDQITCFNA